MSVQGRKRKVFSSWLLKNRTQILANKAYYQANVIDARTVLTEYMMAFSFILFSLRIPTRPYLPDERTSGIRIICSVISAIFGWWGFPHGPIFTLQALYSNLRGGRKYTVEDLFQALDAEDADDVAKGKKPSYTKYLGKRALVIAASVLICMLALILYHYLKGNGYIY
jgi:hypothetical protein